MFSGLSVLRNVLTKVLDPGEGEAVKKGCAGRNPEAALADGAHLASMALQGAKPHCPQKLRMALTVSGQHLMTRVSGVLESGQIAPCSRDTLNLHRFDLYPVMLTRIPLSPTQQTRLREYAISQVHPMLEGLKASLRASLKIVDDLGEGDRLDVVLNILPKQNARYLEFDTVMINGLLEHFQCPVEHDDDQVIPSYWNEWQHAMTYFSIDVQGVPGRFYLNFVRIRRDPEAIPRLDDLVWMGHEIGHQVLNLHIARLTDLFMPAWQQFEGEIAQAKLTAKGRSLELVLEREAATIRYWAPTSQEANWTHELVIDALCVSVFGPAYLWAFAQEHLPEIERYDQHQLDLHPPLRLRTEAMEAVARRLGWGSLSILQPLLDAWQALPNDASESNLYTAHRKPYLVDGALDAALALAEGLGIARLTPEEFSAIDPQDITTGESDARDVILAAWKQRLVLNTVDELESWEAEAVAHALTALREESEVVTP